MKKLSHVLIVAEITRAVTSKTAKDLLGQQFRRQMLMDGQYRNITLICTKSDIIGTPNEIERYLIGVGDVSDLGHYHRNNASLFLAHCSVFKGYRFFLYKAEPDRCLSCDKELIYSIIR